MAGYDQYVNRLFICFLIGILVGTVIVNGLHISLDSQIQYYVSLLNRNTGLDKADRIELFETILRQRFLSVFLIWLIGLTIYALPCFYLLSGGFGLFIGVIVSVITSQKGLMGLPVFLATIFPQIFFYLPVWWILLMGGIRKNEHLRLPVLFFLFLLVTAAGAGEVWLNPYFLAFFS